MDCIRGIERDMHYSAIAWFRDASTAPRRGFGPSISTCRVAHSCHVGM